MASSRLGVGNSARLGLVTVSLLWSSACSGDSNVDFDPVGEGHAGALSSAGTDSSDAGSGASAGSTAGGTSAQGGNGQAGTDSTAAGTDAGGTDAAGGGGVANGGKAGAGGVANGGKAGMGGMGGMGGVANGGKAGMGGLGGVANGGKAGMGGTAGAGGAAGNPSCLSTKELCDGLDNDCDKQVDNDACPVGCTGAIFGAHRYAFCGLVDSAVAAAKLCEDAGMSLPVIESAEENAFLAGKIKGSTWLGGSDALKEGDWFWVDQTPFAANKKPIDGVYSNWLDMQPNNNGPMGAAENCLVLMPTSGMAATTGKWNDLSCDLAMLRAACEKPLE